MIETLFGPLVGPECRRSLSRGWVLLVRSLAVLPPAGVLLAAAWVWWLFPQVVTGFAPTFIVRTALLILEGMLVTVAVVLCPAMLAGTLAGEKLRSTLGLLLACQVSAREIVSARLAGRLCVVGMFLLGGLPVLIFFAALDGLDLPSIGMLILLVVMVAFGGAGLSIATSAVAKRGRDALLAVYLLDLFFLLTPMWSGGVPPEIGEWLDALNPYRGIAPLVNTGDTPPALVTAGLWGLLGVAGVGYASWRLRPSFLHEFDRRAPRQRRFWRSWIPPVPDRAMLWKELYIEQVRSFNRFVRWLGLLIVAGFVGTCLVLAGIYYWTTWIRPNYAWADWAKISLTQWNYGSWPIAWLAQWTIGMRAAVAVASERERGTWDALLVSPLTGREIFIAKLWGSYFALKWFLLAVILAWTASWACGAIGVTDYLQHLADTLVIGLFMVAVGVYYSLASNSATRAMTFTMVSWLAAFAAAAFVAFVLVVIILAVVTVAWFFWAYITGTLNSGVASPAAVWGWLGIGFGVIRYALYLFATIVVAGYCFANFERLSGRSFAEPLLRGSRRARRRVVKKP